jgi:hypothetical protein
MDMVFGETAAHEEKKLMRQIEARLTGRHADNIAKDIPSLAEHIEKVAENV